MHAVSQGKVSADKPVVSRNCGHGATFGGAGSVQLHRAWLELHQEQLGAQHCKPWGSREKDALTFQGPNIPHRLPVTQTSLLWVSAV